MQHTTTYTDIRKNLKSALDKVCSEREPLLVERRNGEDVVIISRDEYEQMEETFYLLKSPRNALHLLTSLAEYKENKVVKFKNLDALRRAFDLDE